MSRRLKREIPGTDWRVPFDPAQPPDWSEHFGSDAKPVVEIGFGRGEFLLDLAAADSAQPFIGVEYSAKRVLKLARRLGRSELRNVRLVEAAAEGVVAHWLADGSVACFWINFPDPWPKKRHFKRRLIQPSFARLLARRLVPAGRLEVATDHGDYAAWIHEVLQDVPELENVNGPLPWRKERPPGRKATAYEQQWRAQGHRLFFLSYRRRAG